MKRRNFLKAAGAGVVGVVVADKIAFSEPLSPDSWDEVTPQPDSFHSESVVDLIIKYGQSLDEQPLPDSYYMLTEKQSREQIARLYGTSLADQPWYIETQTALNKAMRAAIDV